MRGRSQEDFPLNIQSQDDNITAPLVVLVDHETASTSETLAGSLQAQGRALLLGEQTFGKGRTQQITNLQDGSTLLITRNLIYTPSHALIDKVGLTPDRACKAQDSFKSVGKWGEIFPAPLAADPCILLAKQVFAETLGHSELPST
eukprot:jgi/Botrbrau1/4131/Bobra.0192s0006.1